MKWMNPVKKNLVKGLCKVFGVNAYVEDAFMSTHNHEFVNDPAFVRAYERGMKAADGLDYNFRWRVHVALWVAANASKLPGDFVECGVNKGFMSSAIMTYLDWNSLNKKIYLLDTFQGMDERFLSEQEKAAGYVERNRRSLADGSYVSGVDSVKKNFSEWKNVVFVQGSIPDTLKQIDTPAIAYLHLDLNCSPPEVAAIEYLWDRLVPGAFVLFDDYAQVAHRLSKEGMDGFAAKKRVQVVSLPTGQGLLVKPPNSK